MPVARARMSDTPLSLLERLRRHGRAPDWDRLVALYRPLLHVWLRRHPVQGADADDLVQDILAVLVEKVPQFAHSGRPGAFRTWLRRILVYQLRYYWRKKAKLPACPGSDGTEEYLAKLEAPEGELARQWDREHDRHVVGRLLAQIRAEFAPGTWEAFDRYAVQGRPPDEVAAELGTTVNAVFIARSRVLRRLREEAAGIVDDA